MIRAAFLDLNGTLVLPVRVNHLREHVLIPGGVEAVSLLNERGYVCPVVTVQSCIAKGLFSPEDFTAWFQGFQADLRTQGANVFSPYVCPHRGSDACACRKPNPHLYLQAAAEHGITIAESVVIGDTDGDVRAARALGCRGILVRTGWGESSLRMYGAGDFADHIAADLLEAARWLVDAGRQARHL